MTGAFSEPVSQTQHIKSNRGEDVLEMRARLTSIACTTKAAGMNGL